MMIESITKGIEQEGHKPVVGEAFYTDYLSFRENKTGKTYRIIFEYNNALHRDSIRQWSIDGCTETTVLDKFWLELGKSKYIHTDTSSGLCGVRPFERNSITWEFLLKPLGLTAECVFEREHPWAMGVQELLNLMAECGIEVEVLYDCQY